MRGRSLPLAVLTDVGNGGGYLVGADGEDAFGVAEDFAFIAGAGLAGERFEDDLVRDFIIWIPRAPVVAVG